MPTMCQVQIHTRIQMDRALPLGGWSLAGSPKKRVGTEVHNYKFDLSYED